MKQQITLGHLYPKQMNVYGDMGNIISIRYRLESRGISCKYIQLESLADLKNFNVDIMIGGGGQDSNQEKLQSDIKLNRQELKQRCDNGLVCLMVCGMYQLFGKRFISADGSEIIGAGVIDLETTAGDNRLIGNVVINSKWGKLVGFENHGGRTTLGSNIKPLGTIIKGSGNNGQDGTEGAEVNNVFGTYMHGPLLAKNPGFTDELISRALQLKYGDSKLEQLDDTIALKAAKVAMGRPH